MNYKQRRNIVGKGTYEISKELGISEETYINVEKGLLNLEQDRLDKFVDITNKKKCKEQRVEKDIKTMEMKNYLLNNALDRVKALGYKNTNEFCIKYNLPKNSLNSALWQLRHNRKVRFDTLLKFYDLLADNLNKNIEEQSGKNEQLNITKEIDENELEIRFTNEKPTIIINNNDDEIEKLRKENKRLKRQIELYEKLIDRL